MRWALHSYRNLGKNQFLSESPANGGTESGTWAGSAFLGSYQSRAAAVKLTRSPAQTLGCFHFYQAVINRALPMHIPTAQKKKFNWILILNKGKKMVLLPSEVCGSSVGFSSQPWGLFFYYVVIYWILNEYFLWLLQNVVDCCELSVLTDNGRLRCCVSLVCTGVNILALLYLINPFSLDLCSCSPFRSLWARELAAY